MIYSNSITKPIEKIIAEAGQTDKIKGLINIGKSVTVETNSTEEAEALKKTIEEAKKSWVVRIRQNCIVCAK